MTLRKLNPIFKKELYIEARRMKLPIAIFVFNAILAVVGIILFRDAFSAENVGYASSYAGMVDAYSVMVMLEYIMVLCMVPIISGAAMSSEYEKNTMDIILMTRTNIASIVLGKLVKLICTIMLLVLSSLPVLGIIFFAGGISIVDFAEYVFLVGVTTIFVGSIGLLFSTFIKKTIPAVMLTYVTLIFLTIGTYLIASLSYKSGGSNIASNLLLFNPVFCIIKLINNQTASNVNFKNAIEGIVSSEFLINHWLTISVLLQIVSVAVITYISFLISKMRHSAE